MKKVVIVRGDAGFHLSREAQHWLMERGFNAERICDLEYDFELREDPLFVECIETLGKNAEGSRNTRFKVKEYDNENYFMDINWESEYSNREVMVLEPIVRESKIEQCKSTKEIMRYIESLGIRIKEKESGLYENK